MIYMFVFLMLACGYYTFTYGISLWRDDGNKLGSIGVMLAAVGGTIVPIVVMFVKR
jgi:hypothetical protein